MTNIINFRKEKVKKRVTRKIFSNKFKIVYFVNVSPVCNWWSMDFSLTQTAIKEDIRILLKYFQKTNLKITFSFRIDLT